MAKATAQDVNNLYMEYLGRPADPEGSGFYSGKDIQQVAADLAYAAATGVENKAANQAVTAAGGWDFAPPPPPRAPSGGGGGGSAAPSSPVTPLTAQDLYNQFLGGRPALEKDYTFWNNYIAQYGPDQARAAFDAAAKPERDMDLGARAALLREQNLVRPGTLTAQDLYNQFLGGRSALPADIDFWNNYITVYGPDKARSAFQESAEPEKSMKPEELIKSLREQNLTVPSSLLSRFATERKATPAEVRSMYLSTLGREPDPEGYSYWTSQPVENLRQRFYQASIPETKKRVEAIDATTAIPKPVIGTTPSGAQPISIDIPGSFVSTNQGAPKPLTVDISTMPKQQQDLTNFIVSKMPQPTFTAPSMFSPENVNAQLELERLKAMNAPTTTDQGPVAGFAEGGLVGNDINRMLQNQRNAVMRESQSRQMLTRMGAPPVKKFSNGGSAGSSSGVRRLEMSGYQEGGEVNENPYVRMAREERAAQDKAFDSVNRQLSDLLERYKEGDEGITEKDLLPFFPGYNEYNIAQMYGTTTESSVPSMSSKARSFTPEIMSNLRKYDELMQKDFDRLVKEKRLPRDVITARTLGLAKGGEVTNDEYIQQQMMTGTPMSDTSTRPGILPPELREAIDVPLDFANLLIRGTAGVVAGPAYGLYKGVTSEDFGTKKGVTEARSEAERMMGEITGEPKTQAAKDIMQFVGEKLEAAKIPPMPQFLTTPVPGPGAAAALMRSYELAETPPVGAVKLADKGAKPVATPPTDALGFYSPTEQVVMNLSQDKGTASQMLAQITKAPGVKPVELRATGLDEFLKGKGNEPVTKQEIQDFLTSNRVEVDEVKLGRGQVLSPEAKQRMAEAENRMMEADSKMAPYFENNQRPDIESYRIFYRLRSPLARKAAEGDAKALAEINALNLPPDIRQAVLDFGAARTEYNKYSKQARRMEKPKFDGYNIPGGQNAREIYLTLPFKEPAVPEGYKVTSVQYDDGTYRYFAETPTTRSAAYKTEQEANAELQRMTEALKDFRKNVGTLYTVPPAHQVSPEADTNRLAHIFLDDRTDAEGKKVLFVQELQSDWGQQGKEQGFGTKSTPWEDPAYKAARAKATDLLNEFNRNNDNPARQAEISPLLDEARQVVGSFQGKLGPPPAPFVSTQKYRVIKDGKELITKNKEGKEVRHIYDNPETAQAAAKKFGGDVEDMGMQENTEGWLNLALKRVIKEAVDNDIDTVTFIKGEQAAKKYRLSTVLDGIEVRPTETKSNTSRLVELKRKEGGILPLYVNENGVVETVAPDTPKEFKGKPLSEIIGKEMSEKVMSVKRKPGNWESTIFDVEDMEVGGQGMKGFYDNILPKTAEKLLKKLGGGKVEPIAMKKRDTGGISGYEAMNRVGIPEDQQEMHWLNLTQEERENLIERARNTSSTYLGFKITPEMREMVKTQGLPKFAAGGEVTDFIKRAA